MIAAHILAWLSFTVGWLRGGHTERFAVVVLISDYTFTGTINGLPGAYVIAAASGFVITLIFLWLALRSDRWWPFVLAATLVLGVLVAVLELVHPDLSRPAAASAQTGLWLVIYATLLAAAAERWLAGERAVSDTATWRRRTPTP